MFLRPLSRRATLKSGSGILGGSPSFERPFLGESKWPRGNRTNVLGGSSESHYAKARAKRATGGRGRGRGGSRPPRKESHATARASQATSGLRGRASPRKKVTRTPVQRALRGPQGPRKEVHAKARTKEGNRSGQIQATEDTVKTELQ
jgi:hypothetical protein